MAFIDRLTAAGRALTAPAPSAVAVKSMPLNVERAPLVLDVKASEAARHTWIHRVGTEQFPPSDYVALVKRYRTNAVVRRCVALLSQAAAAIAPVAKVAGREDGNAAKAIQQWIKAPNPQQDRFGLIESLAGFYVLHGNCFVEFVPGLSPYAEFYALRPELMTIKYGADGWPAFYAYRPRAGTQKVWPVEIQRGKAAILHIKDFAPDDDTWGRGALSSCERELDAYENAWDMARSLLKNGAMPSGALKYAPRMVGDAPEPTLSDEQFQRLKTQLAEQSSMAKKGKPMLLEGGLDWVQFSMTMVDAQADEIRNGAARGIALAFGIPPMLLGIPGDNTYSNYSEANRAFYRQAVLPLAQKLWARIGHWWSQLSGVRELELEIDTDSVFALAEEITEKWARLDAANDLTINEKRQGKGYDKRPEPEADMLYIDGFNQPLTAAARTAEAGAVSAEYGAVQQQLLTEYQATQPGYDPSKDANRDGISHNGQADSAGAGLGRKPAEKKP